MLNEIKGKLCQTYPLRIIEGPDSKHQVCISGKREVRFKNEECESGYEYKYGRG
jgi:hypothetical protein